MARRKFHMDEDPVDVGVEIKRGFARTVASRDRPPRVDGGYVLGVAVWGLVAFAALSIVGMSWVPAAILAAILCWFWPVFLLFDRTRS
jgi:hypothetical protein